MKIGQLAKITGMSASSIRFYEANGLIGAPKRRANGYREYPETVVQTLQIIKCAQQVGFTLEEIRNLLPDDPSLSWPHDELLTALRRKVADIEGMQQRLSQAKDHLNELIWRIENKPDHLLCADHAQILLREVQEQPDSNRRLAQRPKQ